MWIIIYIIGILGGILGGIFGSNTLEEYKKNISENDSFDKLHINNSYITIYLSLFVSILCLVLLVLRLVNLG
jgi:hypothetical protein